MQDFFYSFKVGDERIIRNCLRFKLTPEAAEFSCVEDRFKSEAWLVPSLATMAMGECQAVAVGQTSDLSLVLCTGALCLEELLLHNAPSPRVKAVHTAYESAGLLRQRTKGSFLKALLRSGESS